jgi:hypothetical protein
VIGYWASSQNQRVTLTLKSKSLRWVYENIQVIFASSTSNNLDNSIDPALVSIQDIFTPNPITVEKDIDLTEAAKIMVHDALSNLE